MAQLPGAVVSLSEQIEAATGVDILKSMRDDSAPPAAGDGSGTDASELPPPPAPPDD